MGAVPRDEAPLLYVSIAPRHEDPQTRDGIMECVCVYERERKKREREREKKERERERENEKEKVA